MGGGYGLAALSGILGGIGSGMQGYQDRALKERENAFKEKVFQNTVQHQTDQLALDRSKSFTPMPVESIPLPFRPAYTPNEQGHADVAHDMAKLFAGMAEKAQEQRDREARGALIERAQGAPGGLNTEGIEGSAYPATPPMAKPEYVAGLERLKATPELYKVLGLEPSVPHFAPPGSRGYLEGGAYKDLPAQAPIIAPDPTPIPGTNIWRMPKVDELTGRVTVTPQFDPNFRPGTITHQDALRSLQAAGKIRSGAGANDLTDAEHAAVVKAMSDLQAKAAGDKATSVTLNMGTAKLDLPIGAGAQQWLNAKGEMPSPNMTTREVMAAYMPYKDAVKRLDQEGSSRTFLQHLQYLKGAAKDIFPESTGNSVGDLALANAAAVKRRLMGAQDPAVAALGAIDRPAALQMIKAVSPDARAGYRLQRTFEEITDPYRPWTSQSYTAALDALEKMALTGMAQRGRPGMNLQPGPGAIQPASPFQTSPAPAGPASGSAQSEADRRLLDKYGVR